MGAGARPEKPAGAGTFDALRFPSYRLLWISSLGVLDLALELG